MEKNYDLILNMTANPGLSLGNLKTVGLTADNTALESEDKYLNSQKIQNMSIFKDDEGNFSKSKFHDFYKVAQSTYNIMASDAYTDDVAKKSRTYHRDNIFAPLEQRRKGPEINWVKQSNPFKSTQSIVRLGKVEDGKYTWDELAQREKVLANPREATRPDGTIDESKAIWQDAPNDSWFSNFWETRVAAQWDEDGEHLNPVTGEKETHKKGDLKLNSSGNFYYENLDGRDVYGRRVLNKMNTLTTDGSVFNKYDFFDSDGKDKSVGGTILKNAALVGSMFIPYIGPVVTGLGLASQTAGLLGTLGKMGVNFANDNLGTNINNSIFSEMEGFSKSVGRNAVSEYSQQNMWSAENLIGLVGDVMAQFKEQRFLFEKAPLIFNNKYGIVNNNNYQSKLAELESQIAKFDKTRIDDLVKSGQTITDIQRAAKELALVRQSRATTELDSYIKGYNKIGEILSKTYMTGLVVGDTYGEAKLQGASDNEALWLTLGYAYAEAKLLNTGVGEWLFPELRYNKLHQKAIAEAAVKAKSETAKLGESLTSSALKKGEKEAKKDYVKRLFNIGRKTAEDLYTGYKSTGDKTIKAAFANALGEGTEEVTEEFLADFSKDCFNAIAWLRGDSTRLEAFDNFNWQDLLSRYSMNFLGGFIGGGAAGFSLDNMRNMKKLDHMEFDQAIQELAYIVRNGQTKEFLKTVDEMTLGDRRKSATQFTKEGDNYVWAQGTDEDNQDLAAKNAIRAQVQLFEDILSSEGIKMSDDSFLSKNVDLLPDIKFSLLKQSSTAGRFLQQFNSLSTKLIEANASLLAAKGKLTESSDNKETGNAQVDIADNQKQLLQQQIAQIEQQLQTATSEEQVALKESLKNLKSQLGNQQNGASEVQRLERQLKDLRQQKEDLISGKRANEFLQDSLYEMTDAINNNFIKPSFIRYAEYKTKKKFNEIPENLLGKLQQEWKAWGEMDRAEQVHQSAEIFKNVLVNSMPILTQNVAKYEELLQSQDVANLQENFANWLNLYQDISNVRNSDNWIEKVSASLSSLYQGIGLVFSDETFRNNYSKLVEDAINLEQKFKEQSAEIKGKINDVNINTNLSQDEKTQLIDDLNLQLQALENNYKKDSDEHSKKLDFAVSDQLVKSVEDLVNPYIKQGFINSEVKHALKEILTQAQSVLRRQSSPYHTTLANLRWKKRSDEEEKQLKEAEEKIKESNGHRDRFKEVQKQLDALSSSPIEQILDQFTTSVGSDIKVSALLKTINDILDGVKSDVTQFSLSKPLSDQIVEALNLIDLLGSVIEASKVDEGNIDHIYGYTKVLNEINHKVGNSKWVDLAELKSSTADVLKQDLSIIRNKLNFLYNLYAISSGQKFAEQKRVSLNTNYLFYNRLSQFVAAIPDDNEWEGLSELKNKLNSLAVLSKNAPTRNLTLSTEDQNKIDEEVIQMEDAIYDFFQKNIENVKDKQKLANLLHKNVNLYQLPTETLTSKLEAIDDNSFVWWLATRGALKSTDFHKEYAAIIDNKIAPIPTQEIATYENYASIVNKDFFTDFYNGFRQAIKDDWSTLDEDGRLEIINQQNDNLTFSKKWSDSSAASDKYKDYPFLSLITPKYSSIVFTEGIPGSGKSTGVYLSTIKMIQNNASLRNAGILDNVAFVYAAGNSTKEEDKKAAVKNAQRSIEYLNLDPNKTKAMSLEDMMNSITLGGQSARDKNRSTKDKNNYWDIPENTYDLNSDKEVRSTTEVIQTDKPYSLIIIDEISNIGMFDLDTLNVYAEKYGLTILGAGDCDQSGISGNYSFKKHGLEFDLPINLYNINFIRSPKLGISMRTNNYQKTKNLGPAQYWVNNDCNLDLHYYEDETGLYGDKVYSVSGDNGELDLSDDLDEILKDVDRIVQTLNEGEKIGYVFEDGTESDLYKKLTEKYSDYIELLPGTTSQGKEGQYYIIELSEENGNFKNDLYTAITRSSQGSLVITDGAGINSIQDTETHSESFSENSIAKFAKNRKDVLTRVTSSGNPVKYIAPTKVESITNNPTSTPPSAPTTPANNPSINVNAPAPSTPSNNPPATPSNNGLNTGNTGTVQPVAGGSQAKSSLANLSDDDFRAYVDNIINKDGSITLSDEEEKNRMSKLYPDYLETVNVDDGTSTYTKPEPLELQDTTLPNGDKLSVGDWVVVYHDDISLGSRFGHNALRVHKIYDNGDIELSDNRTVQAVMPVDELYKRLIKSFDDPGKAFAYARSNEAKEYYLTLNPVNTEEEEVPENGLGVQTEEDAEGLVIGLTDTFDGNPDLQISDANKLYNLYMYTFNTFETGVQDVNGYPVQWGSDTSRHELRLDSINGLMNLDKKLGKSIRKIVEYNAIINEIRSAVFNTADKAKLEAKLNKIFDKYFGVNGISTIFGLVSHSEPKDSDSEWSSSTGDYRRLQRHKDETIQFTNSVNGKSYKYLRKTISIEIASNGEDILELPLLCFPNPITIFNSLEDVRKDLAPIVGFTDIADAKQLDDILNKADDISKIFKDKYDPFIKLIKLYRGITDDSFRKIKDKNWTPAKAFSNKGVVPIGTERGFDYLEEGYEYEPEFVNISELNKKQDLVISKLMYSQNGTIENAKGQLIEIDGSEDLIEPGYPFVLMSTDKSLTNTKELVNAFIEDLSNKAESPRVSLIYVLPPKISTEDYLLNLAKIYTKVSDAIPNVGNSETGYRIIETLFADENFVNSILQNSWLNNSAEKVKLVKKLLEEIKTVSEDSSDNRSIDDVLLETIKFEGNTVQKRHFFKNILMELAYPEVKSSIPSKRLSGKLRSNQTVVNAIKDILEKNNLNIYLRANKKIQGQSYGPFNELDQDNDYNVIVNGKPLPYQIHGNVITNTFYGNVQPLLDDFLSNNGKSDKMDYIHRHSVSGYQPNSKYQKISKILNEVKQKTGLEINMASLGADEIGNIAQQINDKTDYVAFKINGKLKIFNKVDFKKSLLLDENSVNSISSLQLNHNGDASFVIKNEDTGEVYKANYYESEEAIEIFTSKGKEATYVLTDDDFNNIHKTLSDNIGNIHIMQRGLINKILNAANSVELTTELQNFPLDLDKAKILFGKAILDNQLLQKVLDTIQKKEPETNCGSQSKKIKLV